MTNHYSGFSTTFDWAVFFVFILIVYKLYSCFDPSIAPDPTKNHRQHQTSGMEK